MLITTSLSANKQSQRTVLGVSRRAACASFIMHTRRASYGGVPPLNCGVGPHRKVSAWMMNS
jgi:hypothetical protein